MELWLTPASVSLVSHDSDFRRRSPTINYPTLRSVVAGRPYRDDRPSNHSMTSLQLSNTDIRTQPAPLRRQVSLRAGARLFESQSSLVRLYMAAPSATTQEEHRRQPSRASNDTETDSSVSEDVTSDDDKVSDRVPSFSDHRRQRPRLQHRESLPAWSTSNALTSSASLSILPSNPSDIHSRSPGREHGHLNGRPNITRHRPSLIQEKPTLYNHRAVAQSDIHVNRTGLEERAMKSEMDLSRCPRDTWDGGKPFESQSKPAKRQSVVGSFLSSISTAMSSIGSRNSSKSKVPTASTSSFNRDSASTSSRTPSIQHQAKRGKRKPFYELENTTADLQSGASYRDLRASCGYPMSNPAMSISTPAFTSYAAPTRSQSYIFQPVGRCTCSSTDVLCLLHKALPSLPANRQIEAKRTKPVRLSAISTTSFKSFVSSAKRSRPQLPSTMIQSNNHSSLTTDRTLGPTSEHGSKAMATRKDAFEGAEGLPSPIVQRAIERHAGRSLLTQANDSLRGIRGLGALTKDHETRNHSVHNFGRKSPLLRTRYPIYRHALSISSPCLSDTYARDPSKVMFSSKPGSRSLRSTVASNVQAQVSVINVRAEIIPPAAPFTQTNQPVHANLDSRQLNVSLGFNFSGTNSRDAQEISWAQETCDSMGTSVGSIPFEKEKIPFFEPFQAEAQQPSYVSFHFDLSHLETQEVDSSAVEQAQSDTNADGEGNNNNNSSSSSSSSNGDDTGRLDSDDTDYISSKNLAPDHDTSRVLSSSAPSPHEIFTMMDLHASTPSTPVPCASSKKRTLEAKGDDQPQDPPRPPHDSTAEPNTNTTTTSTMFSSARPLVIKNGRVVPKKKGRPPPPPRRPPYERPEYEQDISEITDSVAEQFQSLQEHLRKQELLAAAGSRVHQQQQQLLRDWNTPSQRIQYHKSTPCLPVSASLQEHSTTAITTAATTTSPGLLKDSKPSKSRWSWLWWGGRKQKP